MYSDEKIEQAKYLNKFLRNKKIKNIHKYKYNPNLNSILFDYINVNKDSKLPIDYKQYSKNEDEISFMMNELAYYTPNFVYTYSKNEMSLLKERIDGIIFKQWVIDKDEDDVDKVLEQIFLSYSLAYDYLGFIPYRVDEIYVVDLGEEKEIIYQDLSNNYFSIETPYLVKINGFHTMFREDLISEELDEYLTRFGYKNYVSTIEGRKRTISNSIKQILKLTKKYKKYSSDTNIYDFYDANRIIGLSVELTDNRYLSREDIMRNILDVSEDDIDIDKMKQAYKDYGRFVKFLSIIYK